MQTHLAQLLLQRNVTLGKGTFLLDVFVPGSHGKVMWEDDACRALRLDVGIHIPRLVRFRLRLGKD